VASYKPGSNIKQPNLVDKLFKALFDILGFPSRVARRYGIYNQKIKEMNQAIKNKKLDELMSRNYFLINFFIRIPLLVGLLISGFLMYKESDRYTPYLKQAVSPIFSISIDEISFKNLKPIINKAWKPTINRLKFIYEKSPFSFKELKFVIFGFIASFIGAMFLSKNPMFQIEDKIKGLLTAQRYVDENGKPWEFTWTPFAIYFHAYNTDVLKFVKNTRFWNTINFNPSDPVYVGGDMNRFVVSKRYELPNSLIFTGNLSELFSELDSLKSKEANEEKQEDNKQELEEGDPELAFSEEVPEEKVDANIESLG